MHAEKEETSTAHTLRKLIQICIKSDHLSTCRDAVAQDKLGRGEVNRSSVRVLHLKMNPEATLHRDKADSVASELRTENQVGWLVGWTVPAGRSVCCTAARAVPARPRRFVSHTSGMQTCTLSA